MKILFNTVDELKKEYLDIKTLYYILSIQLSLLLGILYLGLGCLTGKIYLLMVSGMMFYFVIESFIKFIYFIKNGGKIRVVNNGNRS